MAGLGGFIITASMIAPEVIALPIQLAGFQAICMLRQNPDGLLRRTALWILFTLCVTANLFLLGWTALLLLPPVALLAPHVRGALGDPTARPRRGWRRIRWRIATLGGTAVAMAIGWLWLSAATGGRPARRG